MDKKQFLKNRPFDENDALQMQDYIEKGIKNNIKSIYSHGILQGLNAESNNNMSIKIKAGKALDSNYNFINIETDTTITIESADSSLNRIDLITLKYKSETHDNIDTTNKYGRGASWVYSKNILDNTRT